MRRAALAGSLIAALALLASMLWLGRLERSGPFHADLELAGGLPATLYLPMPHDPARFGLPDPPPPDERPPIVVVMHGFAADRVMMSVLSRRLAAAGFAVIAIDARGHGANRSPFPNGASRPDAFFDDLAAAVAFARSSSLVDGSRVALLGHSMGAGAVLDFATRDPAIDGVVAVSGARAPAGPYAPSNALLLFASGDPERIRSGALSLARRFADDPELSPGTMRGDAAHGTGVLAVEAPGTDHLSVIFDPAATRAVIDWLDLVFDRRAPAGVEADPRLRAFGVSMLALLLALPGIGWIAGRLAPRVQRRPVAAAVPGLGLLAISLLLSLCLASAGAPMGLVSIEVADPVVSLLAVAGAFAWLPRAAGVRVAREVAIDVQAMSWRRSIGSALAGAALVWLALTPIGVVGHRLSTGPERLVAGAVLGLLLCPFFVAFEWSLRRGSPFVATLLGVAGRVLVIATLLLGVSLGALPPVVGLMVPVFALLSIGFEALAFGVVLAGRNPLPIALIESAWLGFLLAAWMPIRV